MLVRVNVIIVVFRWRGANFRILILRRSNEQWCDGKMIKIAREVVDAMGFL